MTDNVILNIVPAEGSIIWNPMLSSKLPGYLPELNEAEYSTVEDTLAGRRAFAKGLGRGGLNRAGFAGG